VCSQTLVVQFEGLIGQPHTLPGCLLWLFSTVLLAPVVHHNTSSMSGGTVRRRTGTSSDRIHQAAVSASANVPHRSKRHAKQQLTHALESFENLPEYLRDNEFIHGFYRKEQSLVSSLRTLFKLHNETGNVWTHFIGAPCPQDFAQAPHVQPPKQLTPNPGAPPPPPPRRGGQPGQLLRQQPTEATEPGGTGLTGGRVVLGAGDQVQHV
jgi:hypothetical protein